MNLTPSEKQIVCMKFDSYVKKCCRNELRNIEKYHKRILDREISVPSFIENISGNTKSGLVIHNFIVKGHEITINDEVLLMALEMLEPRERELILLVFFMGFKPGDISEELNVKERTVYNRKNKILEKLKKFMEGNV